MNKSKQLGGIIGPAIMAMIASEFPLIQPHLYDAQTPPVICLSGTLMFVAGLSIVRNHNHWVNKWSVLITISGWFFLILGLTRMFGATAYASIFRNANTATLLIIESMLFGIGLVITFKSYRANGRKIRLNELRNSDS
jgi:hypothetical protein